jgi:HrpA-like RNA helicase
MINRYLIDQAPEEHIRMGDRILYDLGLFGPKGNITELGGRVAKLPVSARMGKLLIKAYDYQRDYKVAIVDDAIRIAAVVEAQGILSGDSSKWKRLGRTERRSDLIKQAIVFHRAQNMSPEQRTAVGVDEMNFQRACDNERMLRRRFGLPEQPSAARSSDTNHRYNPSEELQRQWLSRAIIEAHANCVFRLVRRNQAGDYLYKPLSGGRLAVLQKESVVGGAKLIVGSRFNIGFLDADGNQRIQPLLLNAHRVDDDLEWLEVSTPSHLQSQNKEGMAQAFHQPRKKEKGMKSRDFRGGKSTRNGKYGFGKGNK